VGTRIEGVSVAVVWILTRSRLINTIAQLAGLSTALCYTLPQWLHCDVEGEMLIAEAQQDNRRAFVGGGLGVFISGILWLSAAFVLKHRGIGAAFLFIFFGGMLIFPLTVFVSRQLFKRPPASKRNPLGRLVAESTAAMIGGLFAAWLFLPTSPAYVFPLAAIAVGTHYAVFCTAFGDTLFWVLAGLVTAVGVLDILGLARIPGGPAFAVGLLQVGFGIFLAARDKPAKPLDTARF
jgi:hypothetical protein